MTVFTRTWNAAYEAQPADTENISLGASRIRNLKEDIQERGEVDHSWAGDADDGEHKKVSFTDPLGADPTNEANKGHLYTKDVSSKVELFWQDEDGDAIQLTSGGAFNKLLSNDVGEIKLWSTASAPTGWLLCDGSAVSRTTYSALFAVVGTTFGVGDGSTTFNLPDFKGRSPIGVGTGDATRASAWTLAEKPTSGAGGEESHVQTVAELAAHTHGVGSSNVPAAGGAAHRVPGDNTVNTSSSTGSSSAMNMTHPVLGINFIIFANA